jgi:uncharacterized protein (TIGR00730 family)
MRICIFCGAFQSTDPKVGEEVKDVMKFFHQKKIGLVYGGAAIGVMGQLANELMSLGGEVIGVIPRHLMKKEVAHAGLTDLHVVPDMHQRKKMMYELSDAFLIFPGGMGTLDEFFEILTWKQLGLHAKPIAIYNINGYFDHLISFIEHAIEKGLVRPENRELFYVSSSWQEVTRYFDSHTGAGSKS